MEFNVLFALAASLSFTIRYNRDSNIKQDFFVFQGDEAMCHLFRENNTLNLYLQSNTSFKLYQIPTLGKQFNFTWNGFKVNGKHMEMVKMKGQIAKLHFNAYTFLSPYLGVIPERVEQPQLEEVYQNSEINYGLIVLIVLSIGMLLKTDIVAEKVWKIFTRNENTLETLTTDEDSYVEMI